MRGSRKKGREQKVYITFYSGRGLQVVNLIPNLGRRLIMNLFVEQISSATWKKIALTNLKHCRHVSPSAAVKALAVKNLHLLSLL